MGQAFCFAWEENLILAIQQHLPDILVKILGILTEFGDATILVGVAGLFYWSLNKDLGKRLVVYLSTVNVIYPCIKSAVRRLRPYMVNRDIQCLKPVNKEGDIYDVVTQEYSFPSGHANNCIATYGTIATRTKSRVWKVLLILLILLVGFSRFALGVHYPTDVLVGWVVAYVSILLFRFLEKKLGRHATYLLFDVIGIAGFFLAKTNDFFTGYGLLLGATLGIIFEEKKVRFEGTRNVLSVALRTVVGIVLYLGMNTLFKLPFSTEFLNSGTLAAFTVRAIRYTVIAFLLMGVYPMSFSWFQKKKKKQEDTQ